MLAVANVPYAPANCAEEVRAWGAKILRPCQEGAIAQLIEELDKKY